MITPFADVKGVFLYSIPTRSPQSIVICKIFSNFVVSWGFHLLGVTYFMKVFSLLSLTRNLENFTTKRITIALILCIGMHSAQYQLRVWGFCNRLFLVGHSRASRQINEIGSTLSIFVYCTLGVGVQKNSIYYEEKVC